MSAHLGFLNSYPPVTNNIGFINAELKSIVRVCNEWLIPQAYVEPEHFHADVHAAIGRLFPTTGWRLLLIQCRNGWTAVFEDADDVPTGAVRTTTESLRCRGVISTYVPTTISEDMTEGEWGAIQLRAYEDHPTDLHNIGRTLSLINNCGVWEFDESGEPFPCEDVERYRARSVKRRFTLDMLLDILSFFDIEAYSSTFYMGQCALYHPPTPTYTGTELRIVLPET